MNGLSTRRYQAFLDHAGEILQSALHDRERLGISENSTHTSHLSKVLSVKEIEEIIDSGELRSIEPWATYLTDLQEIDDSELAFRDFPELDAVLDRSLDRRDTMAQVLALNESLSGFLRALAFWIDNQEFFAVVLAGAAGHDVKTRAAMYYIKAVVSAEVEGLPDEDLDDVATLIFALTKESDQSKGQCT